MKINDIQPFLMEGIKFGQKEISEILSRSDDFNVGIEYEFRPNEEQKEHLGEWPKPLHFGLQKVLNDNYSKNLLRNISQ